MEDLRCLTLADEPPPGGECFIENVPEAVMSQLLATLPLDAKVRCAALSKTFYVAALHPSQYAHLSFDATVLRNVHRRVTPLVLRRLVLRAGPSLVSLRVAHLPTKVLLAALGATRSLVELDLRAPGGGEVPDGHELRSADVVALKAACPALARLSGKLMLRWDDYLSAAASLPKGGEVFVVVQNTHAAEHAAAPGSPRFCTWLAHAPPSLTGLSLFNSGWSDEEAVLLSNSLRSNATLRFLSLQLNDVGDRGAAALADALSATCGLRGLDLRGNRLSAEGVAPLQAAAAGRAPPLRLQTSEQR